MIEIPLWFAHVVTTYALVTSFGLVRLWVRLRREKRDCDVYERAYVRAVEMNSSLHRELQALRDKDVERINSSQGTAS